MKNNNELANQFAEHENDRSVEELEAAERKKQLAAQLEAQQAVFQKVIEAKKNKKGIEDTHRRQTFLVEKDLWKRFNRISKQQPRGFKTLAINSALNLFLTAFESQHDEEE